MNWISLYSPQRYLIILTPAQEQQMQYFFHNMGFLLSAHLVCQIQSKQKPWHTDNECLPNKLFGL